LTNRVVGMGWKCCFWEINRRAAKLSAISVLLDLAIEAPTNPKLTPDDDLECSDEEDLFRPLIYNDKMVATGGLEPPTPAL
jgi:hypothetical protein